MRRNSHSSILSVALIALAVTSTWAASLVRAAHSFAPQALSSTTANARASESVVNTRAGDRGERVERGAQPGSITVPVSVRFREVSGRGLMARVWVNGVGDFTFAIDTGAGATLLSERVAREARVTARGGATVRLGGLSGTGTANGREGLPNSLALGESDNLLPARGRFIITDALPPGVDGVLDPTEAYWPLGYTIDLPRGELSAFDPRVSPLSRRDVPPGGTIVQWIFEVGSRRPFIMLNGIRRALLDTGSEFGLALSEEAAQDIGIINDGRGRNREGVRDIAGGAVGARRVAPATVNIGSLVLRGVPTDLVTSAHAGAPVLLGRDALQPFRLTFDPLNRLISIAP
jgi:predicted aspartyl protease